MKISLFQRPKMVVRAEKIDEIIRLTGGGNTEAARKHAEELIAQYRK